MRPFFVQLFVAFLFFINSCGKREYTAEQKMIGTWKSLQTTTDLYERGKIAESFTILSDEYNFSQLAFSKNGTFTSSGRYQVNDTDTFSVVQLEPQRGTYRIINNILTTKIENVDEEAKMTFRFDDNNHLTLRSAPMKIAGLGVQDSNKQFVSTVFYIKEK